jgi:hypothetical protein
MKKQTTNQKGEKDMNKTTNNQNAKREAQGSSVQAVHMKIRIPKAILAPNHRKAYAMAYKAGYEGKHLRFVSPIVRNSIVRGYLDGEEQKAREELDRTLANVVREADQAYWDAVDAEVEEMLAEEAAARRLSTYEINLINVVGEMQAQGASQGQIIAQIRKMQPAA